jgi:Frataxin-like domain
MQASAGRSILRGLRGAKATRYMTAQPMPRPVDLPLSMSTLTPASLMPAPLHKQWYHSTPIACLGERKRRRIRGSGEDMNADMTDENLASSFKAHSPVTDPVEFEKARLATLEKLHTAIKPMQSINDPFDVVRTIDSLTIQVEPSFGRYEVEIDDEQQILVFRSPISGAHTYFLSNQTQEWIDTIDLHSFEGLFVRDLIRHCKGVPKL